MRCVVYPLLKYEKVERQGYVNGVNLVSSVARLRGGNSLICAFDAPSGLFKSEVEISRSVQLWNRAVTGQFNNCVVHSA